jgi:hypothetical protein
VASGANRCYRDGASQAASANGQAPCATDGRDKYLDMGDPVVGGIVPRHEQPPELGSHPQAYEQSLMVLDLHALELSRVSGARRDREMKEVYSMYRSRWPDKHIQECCRKT